MNTWIKTCWVFIFEGFFYFLHWNKCSESLNDLSTRFMSALSIRFMIFIRGWGSCKKEIIEIYIHRFQAIDRSDTVGRQERDQVKVQGCPSPFSPQYGLIWSLHFPACSRSSSVDLCPVHFAHPWILSLRLSTETREEEEEVKKMPNERWVEATGV